MSGANKYWLTVATSQGLLPTDVNASSCPSCTVSLTLTSSSYTPPALANSTTYYWKVQAFDDTVSPIHQGEYSSVRSFTTTAGAKFQVGDRVRTTANLNIRTGPGGYPEISDSDYPGYASIGSTGTVLDGPVSAGGYTWWKVQFDAGYTGWCVDNWLEDT